jgi:hypothetical protein
MSEKLFSGFTAYTTVDEYGANSVGNAPASGGVVVTVFF